MQWWIGAGLLLLLAAAIFLVGRQRMKVSLDPTQISFAPDVIAQARSHVHRGDKVGAIRMLRAAAPGLSLLHAKQLVDRMEQRSSADERHRPTDQDPKSFPI